MRRVAGGGEGKGQAGAAKGGEQVRWAESHSQKGSGVTNSQRGRASRRVGPAAKEGMLGPSAGWQSSCQAPETKHSLGVSNPTSWNLSQEKCPLPLPSPGSSQQSWWRCLQARMHFLRKAGRLGCAELPLPPPAPGGEGGWGVCVGGVQRGWSGGAEGCGALSVARPRGCFMNHSEFLLDFFLLFNIV